MITKQILQTLGSISAVALGVTFKILVKEDQKYNNLYQKVDGVFKRIGSRVYLQAQYETKCTISGKMESWVGRKFYLSEHMTEDEVVKTAYTAFKMAVEHEVMEGFKVDGTILFNPHINYKELLKISHLEVKRN